MLILIKIFTWTASPIGILVWGLVLTGLLRLLGWRKTSFAALAVSVAQLLAFSSAFVADSVFGRLENQARALERQNEHAEKLMKAQPYGAIVVLGGAMAPAYPPSRLYPDLNDSSDRVWHAARLYKQGLAPRIIVSGGRGPGLEDRTDIASEAVTIRRLLMDFGVPESAISLEEKSRNTRENAEFTQRMVGESPVALVTSAFHMPRAYATFQKYNVKVSAYPTDYRIVPELDAAWERWLPTAANLQRSETALKEYLALAIRY